MSLTGRTRRRPAERVRKVFGTWLNQSVALDDLRPPPGNRLEKLSGDREGAYSVRINARHRICFEWIGEGAEEVEIVDYH